MEISPAKRAGRILELLREETGQTQQQVAKAVNVSNTTISHLENGTKGAHIDTVRKIGKAIRHEAAITELWGFIGSPGTAATADLLAAYEAEALKIYTWTTTVVHGLLQTESYADALLRSGLPFAPDAEREVLLGKRLERQQAISKDNPPLLWSVFDESVLYRPYGGKDVMREQLAHLEEQAAKANIVLQVMPFTAVDHPGFEGVLGVIEFSDKTPVWYSDAWSAGKLSDSRDEVADYVRYFDLIRAAALSPADSVEFIARTRRERYE